MAAKIKLKRIGKKKKPVYRIVIQDESSATNSEAIDIIGLYEPMSNENKVKFDEAKTKEWLGKGAAPTDKVRILLGKAGILSLVSFEGKKKKLPKAQIAKENEEAAKEKAEVKEAPKAEVKEEAKEEAKAEAVAEPEAPKEEKPAEPPAENK